MEFIPNFRNIVIGFVVIVLSLFIFDLYYLWNLYYSIEAKTTQQVINSIKQADNLELLTRMDMVQNSSAGSDKISINRQVAAPGRYTTITQKISQRQDTITEKKTSPDSISTHFFADLIDELHLRMHQSFDALVPVDLHMLDSLITINLSKQGINTEVYNIEVINTATNEIIAQSSNSFPQRSEYFVYEYDKEKKLGYKVYTGRLLKTVMGQMSGIAISTLSLILIFAGVFWYFIHTVLRLKTLEAMKTDFVNTMTHELKTPIAIAYSSVDSLLNFNRQDDKLRQEKYLRICLNQLSHLEGLVEQILILGTARQRITVLDKEWFILADFITQIVELFRIKTNKNADFIITINSPQMQIYADPIHLGHCLGNLIDNALNYSKSDIQIEIRAFKEDKWSVIQVCDNGIGIAIDEQAHIFDKFYRGSIGRKYNEKGFGLGLSYVKAIIEKHKGTIVVRSNGIGKGTFFELKLPS